MYNLILNFIRVNSLDINTTLLIFLLALILYKKGNSSWVKRIVLSLVIEAEKKLGSGTGELKYNIVIEGLYRRLPWILRLIYSEKQLDKLIEDAVDFLREYLADGRNLYSQ